MSVTTPGCKACGSTHLTSFYEIRAVPAHSCLMLPTRAAALAFPRGDIELAFCHACGFIGNVRFDPELERYSPDYEETQAFSPRFLRFLDELDLAGSDLTDAGLVSVVKIQSLKRLNLAGTRVTAGGLAAVQQLPDLAWINLAGLSLNWWQRRRLRRRMSQAELVFG